jgi:uncharacterized protein YdeI (YjbR/CyaY-like superfamily)
MDIGDTLDVTTRAAFRAWLEANYQTKAEIWLVFYKKSSGKPGIAYDESVEEALCFGWVDGLMKGIDGEKYAIRFTPRRKGSNWSESNRQRVIKLLREGKMTPAGLVHLPEDLTSAWNQATGP